MSNHELCKLGWQKLSEGRNAEAGELFKQVLAADPNYAAALHGAGYLAWSQGRPRDAIDLLRRALRTDPKRAEAYLHLAAAFRDAGRVNDAIDSLHRAIQLDSTRATYHAALASALHEIAQLPEALASYRRALDRDAGNIHILVGMSQVLRAMGQLSEAEQFARRAITVDPSFAPAHTALANALEMQGALDGAEAELRAVLRLTPDDPDTRRALGGVLLCRGDLPEGFAEFEFRFQAQSDPAPPPPVHSPRWNGTEARGQTLLVHWEQGFGDTIQFVRFVQHAAARCGKTIVRCQPAILTLLRESLADSIDVVSDADVLPPHDLHIPMMSLPLALGTTLGDVSPEVAYLRAPADYVQRWSQRIPREEGTLRVGLAWGGQPLQRDNARRSLDPSVLAALARVEGITWISLQKERRGVAPLPLIDLTHQIRDFSDTAAIMQQLDLIVTVDTSVAHLAGALARPVWTLLSYAPDWRWMKNRLDSPWYPTMRLFRQPSPGEWAGVVDRVAQELAQLKDQQVIRS